jgi:serine/threonine protein kinase
MAELADFEFPKKGQIMGEGQFSNVHRVRHKPTNRVYALKEVASTDFQDQPFP